MRDRKSTRLNSSHVKISYAVFCLKKKRCARCIRPWPCSFAATPPSHISTLSLHDALPIYLCSAPARRCRRRPAIWTGCPTRCRWPRDSDSGGLTILPPDLHTWRTVPHQRHERSEEHTSELQSRENLVCRLLLEKKKMRALHPTVALFFRCYAALPHLHAFPTRRSSDLPVLRPRAPMQEAACHLDRLPDAVSLAA